jgi:hypothetical protein
MKIWNLRLAVLAAALGLAVEADATLFNVDYTDAAGDTATGTLDATLLGPSPAPYTGDEYLATSGTLYVTTSSDPGVVGTYSLLAGGPGNTISPSGAFSYNDILYFPSDPALDSEGVLGFESSAGIELNIWGNAPDNYSFYAYQGGEYVVGNTSTGSFILSEPAVTAVTSVPEPTTIIAGASLLLPFGSRMLRIARKR